MNPMETGTAIPTDLYDTVEDAPNTLAVDTGGYVVRNTNAFEDALGRDRDGHEPLLRARLQPDEHGD